MNTIVITPAYSHAHHELHRAIMRAGLPWLPLYEHSDLPRVRSALLEQALSTGAERIILVDADTIPEGDALERLAQSPLVTPDRGVWGLYPLREGTQWSVRPVLPDLADRAIAAGDTFPIVSGGLGFSALHRASLERMVEALAMPLVVEDTGAAWHPFCVPFVRGGRYHADDGSLCWRLRETGTALVCDPTLRAAHAVTQLIRGIR